MEEVDDLARKQDSIVISCSLKLNFNALLEKIWDKLALVRVYTKKKACQPDLEDPLVLTKDRNGCTVKSSVEQIHRDLIKEFSYALVWGRSVKFVP